MRLSKKVLAIINNQDTRLKLGIALGFGENWVRTCIYKNRDNGPLTTITAIKLIKAETGLTDKEILTEDLEEANGKKNGLRKNTQSDRKITV